MCILSLVDDGVCCIREAMCVYVSCVPAGTSEQGCDIGEGLMRAGVWACTAGFERSRAIEYCAVYVRVYYGVWKIEKNAS